MNNTEKPYSPKEITLDLDIGDSTLRKWCIALEEAGYFFNRTDGNKRVFFNRDHIVLKKFQNLVQVQNMSLQNAAIIVSSKYKVEPSDIKNTENTDLSIRSSNELVQELFDRIGTLEEQQNELIKMNKALFNQLEEQQRYIEERMNKRDSLLMESLRETQETKKMMIAAEEERKKRKGIFRLFTKNQ
ncbi:DUF3967 domain-containing protein [Bacillus luti]|uniref:DUF3967 domain-containing protein n=1 Tax=Bacillaceae TaxID=186817 RepID=UPI00295FDA12|nr:DUF3967 domain-containing protein [Bacillus cereus]HEF5066730.1 DUF3967 domain-containing protein [Bacillus cereus]HEF5238605.1 DUF3967 domain-containing protein [Bacillus cereus]